MFQDVVHKFHVLKHKFHDVEHRMNRGVRKNRKKKAAFQ